MGQEVKTDPNCFEVKSAQIKSDLEKITQKFSQKADKGILKEWDRLMLSLEPKFIYQRNVAHLVKLSYSIYFIRKKLARNLTLFPFKDHFDVRIFSSSLSFPFGFKPTLSLLTHAYLKNKYELFDEEQILCMIKKHLPEVELVKDSVYTIHLAQKGIKTLYFEVSKTSGLPFYPSEINTLQTLLKQEIRFSVEELTPRLFMVRNEEEILRNILILRQEITTLSDLPQVMILFDKQTSKELFFTVIVVRLSDQEGQNPEEVFMSPPSNIEVCPERKQIVGYLNQQSPIEASVYTVQLQKDPSFLRSDRSLNFYSVRQRVSSFLTSGLGEFRDYNGGIIIKQREALAKLQETFSDQVLEDPDLIENFYYSLSPIEAQVTLADGSLRAFFALFLEGLKVSFTEPFDYFLKFHKKQRDLMILVRVPDKTIQKQLDSILNSQNIVTSILEKDKTYFLSYLVEDIGKKKEEMLRQSVTEILETWHKNLASRQVLKLSLEYDFFSLDPRVGGDQNSVVILKMLFEGLMRTNRQGEVERGLAQLVDVSPDKKTYIFTLRKTVWSDESPVSAYDFEYAWKKVLSPTFKTPFAYLFFPIKNAKAAKEEKKSIDAVGIHALNDHTLKVELEFPAPYFLELTAHTIYSPVHRRHDQMHPNWPFEEKKNYPCNGAFRVEKNDQNREWVFVKNPLYWDADNIKLDEVRIIKSHYAQSYEMFRKGMIHWVGHPLGVWDSSLLSSKEGKAVFLSNGSVYWSVFNTERYPFNNKQLRQAFSMGIDRAKLEQRSTYPSAVSPLPPAHSQVKGEAKFSVEKAKVMFREALQELNLCLSSFPEVPLMYPIGPIGSQTARFLKEEWEKVFGVRCLLIPLDWKTLFTKITEGDFWIGGIGWEPWVNDPIYTLNAFREGSGLINFSKWKDKIFQQTIALAEKETDPQKRSLYYLQGEKILLEDMPVLPLFLMSPLILKKANFQINCASRLVDFKWGYFT